MDKITQGLDFSRDWTNPEDFPTFVDDENTVRADMQALHNDTRAYVNNTIVEFINAVIDAVNDLVEVSVPDGSITPEKLDEALRTHVQNSIEAVGNKILRDNIKDGEVIFAKLGSDVTPTALGCAPQSHRHTMDSLWATESLPLNAYIATQALRAKEDAISAASADAAAKANAAVTTAAADATAKANSAKTAAIAAASAELSGSIASNVTSKYFTSVGGESLPQIHVYSGYELPETGEEGDIFILLEPDEPAEEG